MIKLIKVWAAVTVMALSTTHAVAADAKKADPKKVDPKKANPKKAEPKKGGKFELHSNDLKPKAQIGEDFVYQGMGCNGKNLSPELHWANEPNDTKSYAVTVYDPDAPTGSGFWHWVVIDLPPTVTSLKQGWTSAEAGVGKEITSDFGTANYGGPCPPPGKPHSYIFTVHALKVDRLDLPAGATNAFARFMIEGATISKAKLIATYGRSSPG